MTSKRACISLCERKPSRGRANRFRGMAMILWVWAIISGPSQPPT